MKYSKNIIGTSVLILIFVLHYAFIGYKTAALLKGTSKQENTVSSQMQVTSEEKNEYMKNNEDLIGADYKVFYEDLKPYGTWVEVNLSENSGSTGISASQDNLSDALRSILGIKDASADVNFGWNLIYVWKPSPNMAVSIVAGEPAPVYVPYTNGRWVYSDFGWYFRAATPYEELTHHYGRWVFVRSQGWIWIPGNTWSPAWVSWEDDDDYIAWTPYSAGIYYAASYYNTPYLFEPRYIVCERKHFLEPALYRFSVTYRENDKGFKYKEKFIGRNFINGSNISSSGPNPVKFGRELNRNNTVRINMVDRKNLVSYGGRNYSVYAPIKNLRNGGETKFTSHNRNQNSVSDLNGKLTNKNINTERNKQVLKGNTERKQKKEQISTENRKGRNQNGDRKSETRFKTWDKRNNPEKTKGSNSGNRKNEKGNRLSGEEKRNGFQPDLQKPERNKGGNTFKERKSNTENSNSFNTKNSYRTGGTERNKGNSRKH